MAQRNDQTNNTRHVNLLMSLCRLQFSFLLQTIVPKFILFQGKLILGYITPIGSKVSSKLILLTISTVLVEQSTLAHINSHTITF